MRVTVNGKLSLRLLNLTGFYRVLWVCEKVFNALMGAKNLSDTQRTTALRIPVQPPSLYGNKGIYLIE